MANKYCIDLGTDAALDFIIDNASHIYLCTTDIETDGVPDYAKVIAQLGTGDGCALINGISVTPANFAKADGSVSGRKVTVDEFPDTPVTQSGDAQCIVIVDTTNTRVLYVITTVLNPVVSAGTITIPAWSFELRDPV